MIGFVEGCEWEEDTYSIGVVLNLGVDCRHLFNWFTHRKKYDPKYTKYVYVLPGQTQLLNLFFLPQTPGSLTTSTPTHLSPQPFRAATMSSLLEYQTAPMICTYLILLIPYILTL